MTCLDKNFAIQKRNSEILKVLNTIKKEFEIFNGIPGKAQCTPTEDILGNMIFL